MIYFLWAAVFFLTLIIQGSLSLFDITPNLTVLLAFYAGVKYGDIKGMAIGAIIGIFGKRQCFRRIPRSEPSEQRACRLSVFISIHEVLCVESVSGDDKHFIVYLCRQFICLLSAEYF